MFEKYFIAKFLAKNCDFLRFFRSIPYPYFLKLLFKDLVAKNRILKNFLVKNGRLFSFLKLEPIWVRHSSKNIIIRKKKMFGSDILQKYTLKPLNKDLKAFKYILKKFTNMDLIAYKNILQKTANMELKVFKNIL